MALESGVVAAPPGAACAVGPTLVVVTLDRDVWICGEVTTAGLITFVPAISTEPFGTATGALTLVVLIGVCGVLRLGICTVLLANTAGEELLAPLLKFHVHEAVPCEPPGCIGPTEPLVAIVVEPLMLVLLLGTCENGNCHSNAPPEIAPGVCATPLIYICCVPITEPGAVNCECHDLRISIPSEARINNASGALIAEALVFHCPTRVCEPVVF